MIKNKTCFKRMLNTKNLIFNTMISYFVFFCSNKCEYLMVINDKDIDVENSLIKLCDKICDKKCNLDSKYLKLYYPER
jgi:hypothetical protein